MRAALTPARQFGRTPFLERGTVYAVGDTLGRSTSETDCLDVYRVGLRYLGVGQGNVTRSPLIPGHSRQPRHMDGDRCFGLEEAGLCKYPVE